MKNTRFSIVAALLAAFAFGPAFADKGGGGHGRHGGGHHDEARVVERHDDRGHRHRDVRRDVRHDRVVIVDRHHQLADRSCPPGLAKKHNGCMPPGHARRVIVGQALPSGAVFVVPQRVRRTLPPPPVGYRYAVVDNQVVLVSDRNLVVDIVIRSLLG